MILKNAKFFQEFYRPLKCGAKRQHIDTVEIAAPPLQGFAMQMKKGRSIGTDPALS